jgi:predicted permease
MSRAPQPSAPRGAHPPRAPRIARRLLRLALTRDVRDDVTGDVDERFAADVAERGVRAARWRYRHRALALVLGFGAERVRDRARALAQFRFSMIDVRLGLRMLSRYPVLTVVGMVSLALAIALGAAAFAFLTLMLWPRLPLPDGDRVKTVAMVDQAANQEELRVTADFLRWRDRTSTLTDWAAGRRVNRNMVMGNGIIEPVAVQEATPSMFRLTRVEPMIGRVLRDEDAAPDAPPVMVLGERIWRERFDAAPDIVGRALQLADTPTVVVGIMPAAYRFPATDELWVPLKLDANAPPRSGLGMRMWARLAPGATPDVAAAELAALSARSAADWPETHERLQAVLRSPAVSMVNNPEERTILGWLRFAACLLVVLVSGNVALLMFARAATRESEILVRTALGASRARVIAQFVAEALVLNAAAAAAGLWLAGRTMHWGVTTFARVANDDELLPFWITPSLPAGSLAFGVALAALATAMTGILPAMKLTKGVSSRLRETTAGGGGLKFGGVWTVLIVSQIAVTVFTPSLVYFLRRDMHLAETQDIGVPAAEFLTAQLSPGSIANRQDFDAAVQRVIDDLAATPGVTGVTVADKLPLMWNGYYEIQVDEGGAAPPTTDSGDAYPISTAAVEPAFFSTFDAPPLAGRLFTPADYQGPARVIVVNRAFVSRVLGGRSAIGRRIRYRRASNSGQAPPSEKVQPWLEIVGVVRDVGMAKLSGGGAGVYLPLNRQLVNSVMITGRVAGDVPAAANRLRAIAAHADPKMRLADVQPLSRVRANEVRTLGYVSRLFGIVSLAALVLALTGIFAVMSFAVSRRTREIGIRVALGSSRGRVVLAILRRPLIQVSLGILVGTAPLLLWLSQNGAAMPDMDPAQGPSTLAVAAGCAGYVAAMAIVCLSACVVPVRRALNVDPIAALRAE